MDLPKHDDPLALARACAARGARFLDTRGVDWVDQIDLTRLNLATQCDCVLGQLYGEYRKGADALFLTDEQTVKLGFYAPPGLFEFAFECAEGHTHEYVFGAPYAFEELTMAWREEIQKRRCATRGRIVVGVDGEASTEGKAPALV